MGLIGWILFGIMVLVYISFSRHMARRVEFLSEYIEFLLQNRAVYQDHRKKYAAMLTEAASGSPGLKPTELAWRAKNVVDSWAQSLHGGIVVSNLFGRASPEVWLAHETVADAARETQQKT